jgi:glycerate 2-kinase
MSTFNTGDLTGQRVARILLDHGLDRVLPERALRRFVRMDAELNVLDVAGRLYDLNRYQKIFAVGGGKAALGMGKEIARMLGDRISAGILNVLPGETQRSASARIRFFGAGHPIPNEAGAAGAGRMAELLSSADKETLVIALISGGGSSMMALPAAGIGLEDYRSLCRLMLTVPAAIDEMNIVRKHIDPLKGGGLRRYAKDAGGFITLAISDVPVTKDGTADDPSVIASGPTAGDDSTFEAALRVLAHYGVWGRTPAAIRKYLQGHAGDDVFETLREDSPLLSVEKNQYVIIANNDQAMEAVAEKAAELGYDARPIAKKIRGEVTREIENIWEIIAPCLEPGARVTFASFSTDGVDGRSGLAGAIADNDTLRLARRKGLNHKKYLADFDSAGFFERLDLGIVTGPTGTNVADIVLVLMSLSNRKLAFVFGGEATVKMELPEGRTPGSGGRNTHLALLACEKLDRI